MLRLVIPFLYFLDTRVRSRGERLAWVLTYLVPLLLMAAVAVPGDPGLAMAVTALAVVATYSAYEYGYMVNDSVTILSETRPTLRLPAERLAEIRRLLPAVLGVRLASVAVVSLGIHALTALGGGSHGMEAAFAVGSLGTGILAGYWIYNRVRSRLSIVLFHGLVGARCVGPLAVAFAASGTLTPLVWVLLVVYALPNTVEFAAKPKYRVRWLAEVPARVDAWRVAYYAVGCLLVASMAVPLATADAAVWRALIAGMLYFLVYRTVIVLGPARRWRRT